MPAQRAYLLNASSVSQWLRALPRECDPILPVAGIGHVVDRADVL
jgi:hypothetical protein